MANPDLRRAMKGLQNKEILVPILHTALNDPNFVGFNVEIPSWLSRPGDGYFHPSQHSTWSVRQLALYLMAPQLVESGRMELTGVFSVTQGTFWHSFLQHVLKLDGVLVEDELGFTDKVHMRRGHMDGLLKSGEGLEIKTINSYKIGKAVSEKWLREEKFGYWCQSQEYMDVFGLERMRFLFLSANYPFPMKEFVVEANPRHQNQRREDYLRAIAISKSEKIPLDMGISCCGSPDTCPTKLACQFKG